MNRKQEAGGGQEKSPLLEEREMNELIEFDENAFCEGKLAYVQPETWKNVGVSVVHAIKIMKDHEVEIANKIGLLAEFTKKFSTKV